MRSYISRVRFEITIPTFLPPLPMPKFRLPKSTVPASLRPQLGLPARPDSDALKQLYRQQILGLPSPVDRWLSTNSRTGGTLWFLKDYMYLIDLHCDHNVHCVIQKRKYEVSSV